MGRVGKPINHNKNGEYMKKMINLKSHANSAGYSLIELLIVVAIIAGLVGLAFMIVPGIRAGNRANSEAQHIQALATGVKDVYGTARNFGTLTNTVMINAGKIPDDMNLVGTNVNNVWNGAVTIAPSTPNTRYTITYVGVPKAECVKMATILAPSFLIMTIGGTEIVNKTLATQLDIDPATVATQCSAAATTTMVFTGN